MYLLFKNMGDLLQRSPWVKWRATWHVSKKNPWELEDHPTEFNPVFGILQLGLEQRGATVVFPPTRLTWNQHLNTDCFSFDPFCNGLIPFIFIHDNKTNNNGFGHCSSVSLHSITSTKRKTFYLSPFRNQWKSVPAKKIKTSTGDLFDKKSWWLLGGSSQLSSS